MKKRKAKPAKSVSPAQPQRPSTAVPMPAASPARDTRPRITPVEPVALPANGPEPTVRRGAPMPVLMIVILGLLLYVGDMYLVSTAGQFDARVYYPYHSVKQLEDLQPKSEAEEQYAQGRRVYTYICIQCHQESGQGNPAAFIPPLAGSEWVLAEQPGRIIRIVSKGLAGPLKVAGKDFGQGIMLPVGDQLPGDEEAKTKQVAAVLTYIRSTWGNKALPVTVVQVKAVRAKIKDRVEAWTADELSKIPENE